MTAIILIRVILSVTASTIQKHLLVLRTGVTVTWLATYLVMLGPALLVAAVGGVSASRAFWVNILAGGLLDAAGNLMMGAAMRKTDLSIFAPLNAFRPIIALAAGWLFLSELPTGTGMIGILITCAGAVFLFSGPSPSGKKFNFREIYPVLGLRLGSLGLAALGAVFLKKAANVASAELTVAGWILCGLLGLVVAAKLRGEGLSGAAMTEARPQLNWLLGHGLVFWIMQWLTILIFQKTLLSYSFVFFQLGMILQVIIGRVVFKEPAFARRMAGAVVMGVGSILILWKG